MGKDPAFLFYVSDWLAGTLTFSRAQKGAYLDLLTAQFNAPAGRLSMDDIEQILGSDLGYWNSKLKFKFEVDDEGLFFNRKLNDVVSQRKLFSQKQRVNGALGGHPKKPQKKPKSNPDVSPDASPDISPKGSLSISSSSSSSSESGISNSEKKVEPRPASPHNAVIVHFKTRYEAYAGVKWHVDGGKVGSLVKSLLVTFETPERLCDLIDKFFDQPADDFIADAGRDFGIFYSQVNRLAAATEKAAVGGGAVDVASLAAQKIRGARGH